MLRIEKEMMIWNTRRFHFPSYFLCTSTAARNLTRKQLSIHQYKLINGLSLEHYMSLRFQQHDIFGNFRLAFSKAHVRQIRFGAYFMN